MVEGRFRHGPLLPKPAIVEGSLPCPSMSSKRNAGPRRRVARLDSSDHAHRHRSRRHQNRRSRARCRRRENARGCASPRPTAPTRTPCRRSSIWCAELEKRVGARCSVGIGHPGAISPATGLIKNANSTRLNGRPLHKRSRAPARPAGAAAERRQLPRRLRGVRRRRGRLRHRVRRDPGHRRRRRRGDRRPAAHRRAGDRRRMGPQSPAPSARRRAARACAAIAAARAASRPG